MIPWTDQKLNLLLIFTFYIIRQVTIFNFYLTWQVFQIFWIKSNITEGLEQPKRQILTLNVMAIRVQRHANVSKQATLLDGVDVTTLKWRVYGCGLNRFVHEGMNTISNVKVHLKTRSGNVNILKYLHFHCESLNEPLHLRCGSYLHEQVDLSHTHIRAIWVG